MATAAGIWSGIAERSSRRSDDDRNRRSRGPGDPRGTERSLSGIPIYQPLDFWGDPRAVMVRGSQRLIRRLAAETGAVLIKPEQFLPWLGPGHPHHDLDRRLPDSILLAPPGKVILAPRVR